MKLLKTCPVCNSNFLKVIGISEIYPQYPPSSCQVAGQNVLIEFVLKSSSANTSTLQCRECSHVFLSPTFDEEELDRFYSDETCRLAKLQYRESERVSGRSWAEQNNISHQKQKQRQEISEVVRPARLHRIFQDLNIRPQKICDVGGKYGRTISGFTGSERYVYEKISDKTEGFCTYLSTLDDLSRYAPYDLIVFSHVLEHIPELHNFLLTFKQYLAPHGCFYFEVPLDYQGSYIKRKGIPLGGHINYFTMPSLKRLSVEIGMSDICFSSKEIVWYGELNIVALTVICKASDIKKGPFHYFWPWEIIQDTYLKFKAKVVSYYIDHKGSIFPLVGGAGKQ